MVAFHTNVTVPLQLRKVFESECVQNPKPAPFLFNLCMSLLTLRVFAIYARIFFIFILSIISCINVDI